MSTPERVQVYKAESTAQGGSDSDAVPFPRVIDPQEDALESTGLYIQNASFRDDAVRIIRTASNMMFEDGANTVPLSLSELASSRHGVWKQPVHSVTTANITLSGEQTVNTVALVTGNRCLVRSQTTQTQNGIYIVSTGAWTRAPDADTAAKLLHAFVPIHVGQYIVYINSNTSITLGSTNIWFNGALSANPTTVSTTSGNTTAQTQHAHALVTFNTTVRAPAALLTAYPASQVSGGQGNNAGFPTGGDTTLLTVRDAADTHSAQLAFNPVGGSSTPRGWLRTSFTTVGWTSFVELMTSASSGAKRPLAITVGLSTRGWLASDCDFYDTGNGAGIKAACAAVAALGQTGVPSYRVPILIADGTYTVTYANRFDAVANCDLIAMSKHGVKIVWTPDVPNTTWNVGRMRPYARMYGIDFTFNSSTLATPGTASVTNSYLWHDDHVTYEDCDFTFAYTATEHHTPYLVGTFSNTTVMVSGDTWRRCRFLVTPDAGIGSGYFAIANGATSWETGAESVYEDLYFDVVSGSTPMNPQLLGGSIRRTHAARYVNIAGGVSYQTVTSAVLPAIEVVDTTLGLLGFESTCSVGVQMLVGDGSPCITGVRLARVTAYTDNTCNSSVAILFGTLVAVGSMTDPVQVHGLVIEDVTVVQAPGSSTGFNTYFLTSGWVEVYAPRISGLRGGYIGQHDLILGTYFSATGPWLMRDLLLANCEVSSVILSGDSASSIVGNVERFQLRDNYIKSSLDFGVNPGDIVIADGVFVHPGNYIGAVTMQDLVQLIYDTQHPLARYPSAGRVRTSFDYGALSFDFEARRPTSIVSGAAAAVTYTHNTALGGRGSIAELVTGTTTTGRALILIGESGEGRIEYVDATTFTYFRADSTPTTSSNGTDTYKVFVGFTDALPPGTEERYGFEYTHSVYGGNWAAITDNGASKTSTDTGVSAGYVVGTIPKLEMCRVGTSRVLFHIGGNLVATHTTNLPAGALYPVVSIVKSAGTTSRSVLSDNMSVYSGRAPI